jgi:hypothetical protein
MRYLCRHFKTKTEWRRAPFKLKHLAAILNLLYLCVRITEEVRCPYNCRGRQVGVAKLGPLPIVQILSEGRYYNLKLLISFGSHATSMRILTFKIIFLPNFFELFSTWRQTATLISLALAAVWVSETFGLFVMRGINAYTKLTSHLLLSKTFTREGCSPQGGKGLMR